jgi:hypothetical protein
MYEYSGSKVQGSGSKAGFKSQSAERVLRQFEAARTEPEVVAVRRVQLRHVALRPVPVRPVPLRSALQAASIEVTRPALLQSRSSFSRQVENLFASSLETPRSVLSKVMPQLKRAASACLFQRLSERLAHIQSSVEPSPVRQSSVRTSSLRQCSPSKPVASRLQ